MNPPQGQKPNRLYMVATDGPNVPADLKYPNGVYGMTVLSEWWKQQQKVDNGQASESTVSKLTVFDWSLTSADTWTATVQTDARGEGKLRIGLAIFSNMCVTGIQVNSNFLDYSTLNSSDNAWAYIDRNAPGAPLYQGVAPWWSENKQWPSVVNNELLSSVNPNTSDGYYDKYFDTNLILNNG